MRKLWKMLKQLSPVSASLIILTTTVIGYHTSKPVLDEIVWPEKPIIKVEQTKEDSKSEENNDQKIGNYEDGTYTGTGNGYGGETKVEITVKNGQITTIDILSHQDTESYFAIAKEQMIPSILLNQTWEVDGVSGATYSSRGIKEAVCNAITGEASESNLPEKIEPVNSIKNETFQDSDWKDGTYEGSANGFGGPIKVKVTIKNGKISSIEILSHAKETSSYSWNSSGISAICDSA